MAAQTMNMNMNMNPNFHLDSPNSRAHHRSSSVPYPTPPPPPPPPLPASPTLTNPDMILPDYDPSQSPSSLVHSPATMLIWKNAHAAAAELQYHHHQSSHHTSHYQTLHLSSTLAYNPHPDEPDTPTTPILYGHGTMLSDIGEVTEVESTPGRKPTRNTYSGIPSAQSSDDDDDDDDDCALRSSPTMGYKLDATKRLLLSLRQRRASADSTSTVATETPLDDDSAAKYALAAAFDDVASLGGDSMFQGDDEESLAEPYTTADGMATPRAAARNPPLRGIVVAAPLGGPREKYSTSILSQRAEQILANAKKRLTTMEGNLNRARISLHTAPTSSSALDFTSTPSPQPVRPATSFHQVMHATGHSRGLSQDSAIHELPTTSSSRKRSASAMGAVGGYRPRLASTRSTDSFGGVSGRFPVKATPPLDKQLDQVMQDEPRRQDDYSRSHSYHPSGAVVYGSSAVTSPAESMFSTASTSRSASVAQVRSLTDQMKDLKDKISSLKEQARADSLKRRSFQNMRTPSPFTHARWDHGYVGDGQTAAPTPEEPAATPVAAAAAAAAAAAPASGERTIRRRESLIGTTSTRVDGSSLGSRRSSRILGETSSSRPGSVINLGLSSYNGSRNNSTVEFKPAREPVQEISTIEEARSMATTQIYEDEDSEEVDGNNHATYHDVLDEQGSNTFGSFTNEHKELGDSDSADDDDDNDDDDDEAIYQDVFEESYQYSQASSSSDDDRESLYHDSLQTPLSHEDREDAFDYERFFLHSAMGTISQQRMARRGRSGSSSSEDSAATERAAIIAHGALASTAVAITPGVNSAVGRVLIKGRKRSSDSLSTMQSFATADEDLVVGTDLGNLEEIEEETTILLNAAAAAEGGAFAHSGGKDDDDDDKHSTSNYTTTTTNKNNDNEEEHEDDEEGDVTVLDVGKTITEEKKPGTLGISPPPPPPPHPSNETAEEQHQHDINSATVEFVLPATSADVSPTQPNSTDSRPQSRDQEVFPDVYARTFGINRRSVSAFGGLPAGHRPSVSSVESTGTNRSFPLVNRPRTSGSNHSRSNSVGTATWAAAAATTPRGSPEQQDLKQISEELSDSTGSSSSGATLGQRRRSSVAAPAGEVRVRMLPLDEQALVEKLVASLGRCVLGLSETGKATAENRMYRRRIDAARRLLEGVDGPV